MSRPRTSLFKLFALPTLPIEKVITFLSVLEVFELSQCSTESRKIVKKSTKKCQIKCHLENFTVNGNRGRCNFNINDQPGDDNLFVQPLDRYETRAQGRTILGQEFSVRKSHNLITIYTDNVIQVLRDTADYILDLFSDENILFKLTTPLSENMNPCLIEWKKAQNADEIRFAGGDIFSATFVRLIDELFRNTKKKIFLFDVPVQDVENVRSIRLPAFRRFSTNSRNLMAPEMLFGLDAEYIVLRGPDLVQSAQLNEFIKAWMSNVEFHKNLYVFHVMMNHSSLNPEEVVEGLQLLELDGKRRPGRNSIPIRISDERSDFAFEAVIEKDMIRSDGKVATMAVNHEEFLFVVWDNKTLLDAMSLQDYMLLEDADDDEFIDE